MLDSLRRTIVEVKAAKGIQDDQKMRKYLGKTDKLLYICHGKADKIRPFNIRKGDKVSLVNNSGIPIYLLFRSGCF